MHIMSKVMNFSNLSKSVEERFGQSFTSTTLSEWILTAKDLGFLVLNMETHAQFRNVDLSSVIKAGV